jgi:hypothetical protein
VLCDGDGDLEMQLSQCANPDSHFREIQNRRHSAGAADPQKTRPLVVESRHIVKLIKICWKQQSQIAMTRTTKGSVSANSYVRFRYGGGPVVDVVNSAPDLDLSTHPAQGSG